MAFLIPWVRKKIETLALAWVFAGLCVSLPAQTLAHRNWAGSGITVAPWWRGAEFYLVDPISFQDSNGDGFGDLPGLIDRLDYLQALGVDVLVLSPFQLGTGKQPFDPAYGSEEDFERLIAEATGHHLRVIVDLPVTSRLHAPSETELLSEARFWLIRGVAGLRLTGDTPQGGDMSGGQQARTVSALRRLCASFAGQRVLLLASGEPGQAEPWTGARLAHARRGHSYSRRQPTLSADAEVPLLRLDDRLSHAGALTADALHAELVRSAAAEPVLTASDADGLPRSFSRSAGSPVETDAQARILAAALLLGPGDPLLFFGQEIGMASAGDSSAQPSPMQWGDGQDSPSTMRGFTTGVPWIDMGPNAATANVALELADADSLLNWYRRLSALRHGNPALRSGSVTLLPMANPDLVAWVRRPQAGDAASPVVVVMNLSARAAMATPAAALERAGVHAGRGTLSTLASTFGAGPALAKEALALPAYGVYVAELRPQPGLETVVLAPRSRRSRP